jgi:hypothetical protein
MKGNIEIENGKKVSLYDAIQMNTMTKIDEIALINGRFVEITNVWYLAWVDKKGNYDVFDKEALKYPENLRVEIEKFYFSDMFYSPFKVVKRIYAYSRNRHIYTKNPKWGRYIDLVVPLLQSDVSLAYQIKSELDTLVLVLNLYKRPSPVTINNQLDNIKQKIASVLSIKEETLQQINSFINAAIESSNNKSKIISIDKVTQMLKNMINYETIGYLSSKGLNPPPKDLLPNVMSYKYITRLSTDDPEDPVDKIIETLNIKGEGCETCGGVLLGGGCLQCRDDPHMQLANMIKNMYQ